MEYEWKNKPDGEFLTGLFGWTADEANVADIADAAMIPVAKRIFGPSANVGLATALAVGMSAQYTDPDWIMSKWFRGLQGRTRLDLTGEQASMLNRWWSGLARSADFAYETGAITADQRQRWLDETYEALFANPNPFAALTEVRTNGA